MKKYIFTIHGNPYEVLISNVVDNLAEVEINGTSYQIELEKSAAPKAKTPILVRTPSVPSTDSIPSITKTSAPSAPKGSGTIKSPLPGVILDVFIRVGDSIKIGQKLLLLEAMKMENKIESDKDGIVKEVRVKNGDSVMEGDVLIVIE